MKKLSFLPFIILFLVLWIVSILYVYFFDSEKHKLQDDFLPWNTWSSAYFSQRPFIDIDDGSYASRRIFYIASDSNTIFLDPTFWHYWAKEWEEIGKIETSLCWDILYNSVRTDEDQSSLSWQINFHDWLLKKVDICYDALKKYAITKASRDLLEGIRMRLKETIMQVYKPSPESVVWYIYTIPLNQITNLTKDLINKEHFFRNQINADSTLIHFETASLNEMNERIETTKQIINEIYNIRLQYTTEMWRNYVLDEKKERLDDAESSTKVQYIQSLLRESLRTYIVDHYPEIKNEEYSWRSDDLLYITNAIDEIVKERENELKKIFAPTWDETLLHTLITEMKETIKSNLIFRDKRFLTEFKNKPIAKYDNLIGSDSYREDIKNLRDWHMIVINNLFSQHWQANILQKISLRKDITNEIDSLYKKLEPYVDDTYYYYAFKSEKKRYIEHLRELLY